jgi:HSP20 family protein
MKRKSIIGAGVGLMLIANMGLAAVNGEPKFELREQPQGYEVMADVPGMDQKDVKVGVLNNVLTISATRQQQVDQTNRKGRVISSEFDYGSFARSIRFDKEVDPKSLRVDFKNGVVDVHVNKI